MRESESVDRRRRYDAGQHSARSVDVFQVRPESWMLVAALVPRLAAAESRT